MSRILAGVGTVALAAASVAIWVQHEDNAALRTEVSLLRDELRDSVVTRRVTNALPVAAGGSQPSADGAISAGDFAKLREEIAGLKKNTQQVVEFVQMAQAAVAMKDMSNATGGAPEKVTSASELKNLGKATPDTAVQTTIWAAIGGEVDVVANGITFTPAGRAKADAWFASLSDITRQQYGSPENVIALLVSRDAAGLAGMQVLGQKEISPNDVGVRVRFATNDGQTKDDNMIMHRTTDGWRLLLNDTVVQKFANKLGGGR
jgi:hypothetical protein